MEKHNLLSKIEKSQNHKKKEIYERASELIEIINYIR